MRNELSRQLRSLSPSDLVISYSAIQEELKARGFMEDRNGLTGNLAEVYFCAAHGAVRMNQAGYDTIIEQKRVQIKGGLITTGQTGRLLRYKGENTSETPFDLLAIVMFGLDYDVMNATLIRYEDVHQLVRVNSGSGDPHITFGAPTWKIGSDITSKLRTAADNLNLLGSVPLNLRKPKKSASKKNALPSSDIGRQTLIKAKKT